jgi:hypothetical protein
MRRYLDLAKRPSNPGNPRGRGRSRFTASILRAALAAVLGVTLASVFAVGAQAQIGGCCAPIRGTAKTTTGQILANGTVVVRVGEAICGSATTDSSGNFSIPFRSTQTGGATSALPAACQPGATAFFDVGGQTASQTATLQATNGPSTPAVVVNLTQAPGVGAGSPATVSAQPPPPPPPPSAALAATPAAPAPATATSIARSPSPVATRLVPTATGRTTVQGGVAKGAPAAAPAAARLRQPTAPQPARAPSSAVSAAPVSQAPAVPAAAPRLPSTGSGGLLNAHRAAVSGWIVLLAMLAALCLGASGALAGRAAHPR